MHLLYGWCLCHQLCQFLISPWLFFPLMMILMMCFHICLGALMILNFLALILNIIFDHLYFLSCSYMSDAWMKTPHQCHQTTNYQHASPHLERGRLCCYWIFTSTFYLVDFFFLPTLISDTVDPLWLVFLFFYQFLYFDLHFPPTENCFQCHQQLWTHWSELMWLLLPTLSSPSLTFWWPILLNIYNTSSNCWLKRVQFKILD